MDLVYRAPWLHGELYRHSIRFRHVAHRTETLSKISVLNTNSIPTIFLTLLNRMIRSCPNLASKFMTCHFELEFSRLYTLVPMGCRRFVI